MASVEKRPHVKTEKMAEFLRSHGESGISPAKLLHCPLDGCNKVLTSSPGLRYHMRTHNSVERPYECHRCQKTFKSANGLKYHLEKTKCDDSSPSHQMNYISAKPKAVTNLISLECDEEGLPDSDSDQDLPKMDRHHLSPSHLHYDVIDGPTETVTTEPSSHFHMSGDVETFHYDPQTFSALNYKKHDVNAHSHSSPVGPGLGSPHNIQSQDSQSQGSHNWLEELAEIATGPQSPLMQRHEREHPLAKTQRIQEDNPAVFEKAVHSYAKSPNTPIRPEKVRSKIKTPSKTSRSISFDTSDTHVTSSSPFPTDPVDNGDNCWPRAVWQCFIAGTQIRFTSGPKTGWQKAEALGNRDRLTSLASHKPPDNFAPDGLRLLHIEEKSCDSSPRGILELRFTTDVVGSPELISECDLDHPFYVKDKGWSSYYPNITVEHYGIPCCELELNDVCLPPDHSDTIYTPDVFNSFKSYDFTPADSSAVFTLSSMAMQKRDQELSPCSTCSPGSPSRKYNKTKHDSLKAKRPMNAFMIFAKKYRLEYTQLYPGKDNRAISVLLGDKWKRMKTEERKVFATEAKVLAEHHKKINPDCWKRRRSNSGSFSYDT
ncbi:unnamed protein product [Owenia fusiformis]|uniref:HMG box-containing protein 1 n=1 Tax=Owenia fusiformis TaxID=6347 RepID=A0A8J1T5Q1_OWEFU|nr:unnamed protein product [Owenia fusiformis]